jgi:hypothetical protein
VAAIGVAQAPGEVVVFGEEEGGESAVRGIVAKELVHGAHEALQLIQSDGALAAHIGLQIGHEEGGSDAFSRDVADDETEALLAEIEEVVIVAADFAGLDADAGVFESFERGKRLWEETRLDLFGNFELLSAAVFGRELLSQHAALCFDFPAYLVDTDKPEGVSVKILERGNHAAPKRFLLRARFR